MSLTNRKGPNIDGSRNRGKLAARKRARAESAQARQHVCSLMHPQARLALIEGRPGNSERERARLVAQIEKG